MTTFMTEEERRRCEIEMLDFQAKAGQIVGQLYVEREREQREAEENRKAERKARAKQRCELVAEQLATLKKDPAALVLLAVLGKREYPKQVESPLSIEKVQHLSVDDAELAAKIAHALCDGEPVDHVLDASRRSAVRKALARSRTSSTSTTLAEMASRLAHAIVDDMGCYAFTRTLAAVCTLLFLANHGYTATVDLDGFVADFPHNDLRKSGEVDWSRVSQRIAAHSSIVVW